MHADIFIETDAGAELTFCVEFDYQPAERAVWYPNDKAYPGCPASVDPTAAALTNPRLDKSWQPLAEAYFWKCYDANPAAFDDQLVGSLGKGPMTDAFVEIDGLLLTQTPGADRRFYWWDFRPADGVNRETQRFKSRRAATDARRENRLTWKETN